MSQTHYHCADCQAISPESEMLGRAEEVLTYMGPRTYVDLYCPECRSEWVGEAPFCDDCDEPVAEVDDEHRCGACAAVAEGLVIAAQVAEMMGAA